MLDYYTDLLQRLKDDVSYCNTSLQSVVSTIDSSIAPDHHRLKGFVASIRWLAHELNYLDYYTRMYGECTEEEQLRNSYELHEKWRYVVEFSHAHDDLRAEADCAVNMVKQS